MPRADAETAGGSPTPRSPGSCAAAGPEAAAGAAAPGAAEAGAGPGPAAAEEELPPFPDSEAEVPMLGPEPKVPMMVLDEAVSPDQVHQEAYVNQVDSAEVFLQWCRVAIDSLERYMQGLSNEDQKRIRETLRELAAKVRQGEKVQAMAQVSLEAAGSLCLFCGDHG